MLVFEERGNRSTRNFGRRVLSPYWWEASALTTAPSLHPICCACKNLIDLELKLYHELIAVAGWMKSKRLALSIVKTNCIVFPSKKMKPYKTFNLTINGANIQQFSTIKYRGISFDANLTCKSHNDRLCLKMKKTKQN